MVKLRALKLPRARTRGPVSAPSDESKPEIELRLGVHDSSRVEWAASVPMPETGEREYQIEFTLEIPAHLYSPHNVWDHKQTFTRLQSPSEAGELHVDRVDLDELRRDTLGVAHRLSTLRHTFERTCAGAAAQLTAALHPSLEDNLIGVVTQAVDLVAELRRALDEPAQDGPEPAKPELEREWMLADEFLSHRLLDLLGAAQKNLDEVLLGDGSRLRELDAQWVDDLRILVADSLGQELVHRRQRGYVIPRAESPSELSRFVERGSMLKKHFQDVLYLDVDAYMVDYRLRNWTGIVAASLAAAFWMGFTLLPIGQGTKAGIGVGTFAVVFAASYALKDRIKELTRGWLAGRLVRLYGQRAVTLRLPTRVDTRRAVVLEARETFNCVQQIAEDVLNRNVGRTQRVMMLTFRMRTSLRSSALLQSKQIRSIKHVFRYDLDPIFSRLDNAVKPVPVLDEATRRVRFVEAPKEYRVPVCVIARPSEKGLRETRMAGVLVLSKRGIDRLEPVPVE
jgi:hypothetical protein